MIDIHLNVVHPFFVITQNIYIFCFISQARRKKIDMFIVIQFCNEINYRNIQSQRQSFIAEQSDSGHDTLDWLIQ